MAQEKGIAFEVLLPKRVFVYVDPLSIERILDELLSNAVKFTDQGKITVQVSCETPEEVLTEISDTGCGIPKEKLDEIWELFKRVEQGTKRDGSGIGLAMVRQLIEANGGRIWVNSQVGKGSSFCFTLPTGTNEIKERR
jgi:signal transduction histidine kinase